MKESTENSAARKKEPIRLSDHFTYGRILRFALPSIVMFIFTSIYSVVDGFFISNYAGKIPFAGVNLIMPFIMIVGTVGFMFGTGGSALVAKTLGEGDPDRADRYFSEIVEVTVLLGLLLTVIGFAVMPAVARLLGADEDMLPYCVLYGRICMVFILAFMLQNVFQAFFVTAEKPRLGLTFTVCAGLTNMFLDFLFVGVLRWGVAGAAVATGVSESVGGLLPFIYFLRKNSSRLHLQRARIEWGIIGKASGNGASELMNNISTSIVSMLYNFQLLKYAGANGVAAYGVLMYVSFIFMAVFIGYAVGTAPIVGYHYGAHGHGEMKNVLRKSLVINGVFGVAMMVASWFLAGPLSRLYVGYDPDLFAMTVQAFHINAAAFLVCGVNIYTSSFFTALNNGVISAIVSFLRSMVFECLSVLLMPLLFGLTGIWLSWTVAEVGALIVSICFLVSQRKWYHY